MFIEPRGDNSPKLRRSGTSLGPYDLKECVAPTELRFLADLVSINISLLRSEANQANCSAARLTRFAIAAGTDSFTDQPLRSMLTHANLRHAGGVRTKQNGER